MTRFFSLSVIIAGLAFGLLLTLAAPTEASAQLRRKRSNGYGSSSYGSSHRSTSRGNLPSWSEPSQYESPSVNRPSSQLSASQAKATTNSITSAPAMPMANGSSSPSQVPLGGLEWLALAGAGYAIGRLRRRGDDEVESGDDAPV